MMPSNPAAMASFKKEWMRLSRSRAGRGGPTGLVIASTMGFLVSLYALANPEMMLTAAEMARSVHESKDLTLGLLGFGMVLCGALGITAAMMAADLVNEERRTGTLQALRLTPISPFLVISAKTMGTVAFQSFIYLCLSPMMMMVCGLTGVPMQIIWILFPYLLAISVALSGLSVGLTAATSATASKLFLSLLSVVTFMFTTIIVVEAGQSMNIFSLGYQKIAPAISIILVVGFLAWGMGVLAASRKLFHPGATPLSVGQAGVGGNLALLLILAILISPAFSSILRKDETRLVFSIGLALLSLFSSWITLAQTIPARHGLKLDWPTLDGNLSHPGRAFYLCIPMLVTGFWLGPALINELPLLEFLPLAFWGISSSLFWFSLCLWIAMAWSRLVASAGPYIFWIMFPFFLALFSLSKEFIFGFPKFLIPFTYLEIMGNSLESNLGSIDPNEFWQQFDLFPFLGVALPFIFLLLAFLMTKLPLPKPRHPFLPKDFKAMAQV